MAKAIMEGGSFDREF